MRKTGKMMTQGEKRRVEEDESSVPSPPRNLRMISPFAVRSETSSCPGRSRLNRFLRQNRILRYIGKEQSEWLRVDLSETALPRIIFSHQSIESPGGLENGEEVRGILEKANEEAGFRKVFACFSGLFIACSAAGFRMEKPLAQCNPTYFGAYNLHLRYG